MGQKMTIDDKGEGGGVVHQKMMDDDVRMEKKVKDKNNHQ